MPRRLLLVCPLTLLLFGCGGDGGRGVNRDRDRPRALEPPAAKDGPAKDKPVKAEPGKK